MALRQRELLPGAVRKEGPLSRFLGDGVQPALDA